MSLQAIIESLGVTLFQYALDVILLICSGFFICFLRKLLQRVNVNLSEAEYEQLINLVDTVVNATNQTITEKLKLESTDGKLTEEQCMEIFNSVKEVVMNSLSDSQRNFIEEKYLSMDDGLRFIIEDAVSRAKQKRTHNHQIEQTDEF